MRLRFTHMFALILLFLGVCAPSGAAFAQDALKNTDPEKYYILLDLNNQVVTVFERDAYGEYTKIVRRFLCSSGRTELDPEDPEDVATPTPRGIWKIGGRERFGKFASFGGEYARYWTQIVGSVFFHSVMFSNRTVNSMQRSAFKNLGSNVSHGCVRLYVEDAKWLYYYACPGTTIEVSTDEPRNRALRSALKSSLSFSAYNQLQKAFYDEPELPNDSAWVTAEGARLKEGSGSNFSTVARLSVGDELEVLMRGEAWVKVRFGKREGYVRRGYISYRQDVIDTRSDATLMKATDWLYSEPNTSSERIVKVPVDVSVGLLETLDGGWSRIAYQDEAGYVKTARLTTGWGAIVD